MCWTADCIFADVFVGGIAKCFDGNLFSCGLIVLVLVDYVLVIICLFVVALVWWLHAYVYWYGIVV